MSTKMTPRQVIGAGYKWLLWPYGLGFLYASPEHHHGEGLEQHGWADSEQRSGRGLAMWGLPGGEGADGTLDLYEHPTARRLEMGGRPFLDSIPVNKKPPTPIWLGVGRLEGFHR